jgi:hypothetical protein
MNARFLSSEQNRTSDFKYAGIIFIQGNQVLAGLQRKWKRNGTENRFISGFGGSKKSEETSLRTAIRETLEELYEFIEIQEPNFNIDSYPPTNVRNLKENTKIPEELLYRIQTEIHFAGPFVNGSYHLYKSNYKNLIRIFSIVNEYLAKKSSQGPPYIVSIAYRKNLPKKINDLILFPRQDLYENIEILQIYNLYIDENELQKQQSNPIISKNFLENIDIMKVNKSRQNNELEWLFSPSIQNKSQQTNNHFSRNTESLLTPRKKNNNSFNPFRNLNELKKMKPMNSKKKS